MISKRSQITTVYISQTCVYEWILLESWNCCPPHLTCLKTDAANIHASYDINKMDLIYATWKIYDTGYMYSHKKYLM